MGSFGVGRLLQSAVSTEEQLRQLLQRDFVLVPAVGVRRRRLVDALLDRVLDQEFVHRRGPTIEKYRLNSTHITISNINKRKNVRKLYLFPRKRSPFLS